MKNAMTIFLVSILLSVPALGSDKPRARDIGIAPGILAPGNLNAITDVRGVKVGQVTVKDGARINTGVTVIIPADGNLRQDKVPAAIYVANGYGKLAGISQVKELGELEEEQARIEEMVTDTWRWQSQNPQGYK